MLKSYLNGTFSIKLFPDQKTIYLESNKDGVSRSVITGYVLLTVKKPTDIADITVYLSSKKQIQWDNGMRIDRASSTKCYKNSNLPAIDILVGRQDDGPFPVGQHKFNFELWIPENLEPSVTLENNYLEYHLEAKANLSPKQGFSFTDLTSLLQGNSDSVKLNLRLVPEIFACDPLKPFYRRSFNHVLYSKNNFKVTMVLDSQYLTGASDSSSGSASLVVSDCSINPLDVKLKSVSLKLIQKVSFVGNTKLGPSTHSIVFGSSKSLHNGSRIVLDLESSHKNYDDTPFSSRNPSFDSLTELEDSFGSRPGSPVPSEVSFAFSTPPFDYDPTPAMESAALHISHFLESKFVLEFSNQRKPMSFSNISEVSVVPKWAEGYICNLPSYNVSDQDILLSDKGPVSV
ncbi:hypothetical protein AYI68_g5393 [Smittium mucronatum]|uniref:Arrestin-like N-terminal domain-containing protein n=1 Tax=Smittium mucronatum TaxID=133383 RepID=A0A1R0GUE1_9FUNG|nr:hypothetical protein AYI68_g5393 [Smittium mucronatum]